MGANWNMDISVIIPMFNSSKTIERCLDGLLGQLTQNDEIIVIDDGSTDDSLLKVKNYAEKNPIVNVIKQKNMGVGVARNIGIENSRNEWITFVDSDDFVDCRFKEIINKYVDNSNPITIFEHVFEDIASRHSGNGHVSIINSAETNSIINKNLFNEIDTGQFGLRSVWANVYSRDFIIDNGIAFKKDLEIGEDMLFMMEVFRKASRIVFVNLPIYHYYFTNTNSLVNKYKPNLPNQIFKLDKYFAPLLCEDNRGSYAYYKMNDIILLMKYTFFNKENRASYKEKRKGFVEVIRNGRYKEYYCFLCNNNLIKRYGFLKRITFWLAIHEKISMLELISYLRWES